MSLDALHSQLLHEPKKVAIIGSGCSVATEAAAEVSHYYNITQVSHWKLAMNLLYVLTSMWYSAKILVGFTVLMHGCS